MLGLSAQEASHLTPEPEWFDNIAVQEGPPPYFSCSVPNNSLQVPNLLTAIYFDYMQTISTWVICPGFNAGREGFFLASTQHHGASVHHLGFPWQFCILSQTCFASEF